MAAASCKGQSPEGLFLPQAATRQIPDSNQFIEDGLQPDEWLPFRVRIELRWIPKWIPNRLKLDATFGPTQGKGSRKGFANLLPKRIILLVHSPNSMGVEAAELSRRPF
jgi:hypothetical protein